MELHTLLQNTSSKEPTQTLRTAFAPYSEHVDITGSEPQALVILINLTYKRKDIKDLTSVSAAKAALRDEQHLKICIDEVKWYHTHNLKYPDIRVSHQRLLAQVVDVGFRVVSSSSYPKQFGWSHDSAKINHTKLFLTGFVWRGEYVCLAQLLAKQEGFWVAQFRELGLLKRDVVAVCEQIAVQLPNEELPEQLSNYTPQLLIPIENDYLSVSPVVSHAVLAALQLATRSDLLKRGVIEHNRPANVGELPSALGGRVNVLKYFAKTYSATNVNDYYSQDEQRLFNVTALNSKTVSEALRVLSKSKPFNTLRQKRLARIAATKALRTALDGWLEKLIKLAQNEAINNSDPEPVKLLATQEFKQLELVLSQELNRQMSGLKYLKRYAYHPELMPILKAQLSYVLSHQNNQEDEFEAEHIQYVHCQNLRVYNAEAMPNPYLMGMPSITALEGLGHQFQRKLQKLLGGGVHVIGVAVYVRSYQLHNNKQLPEPNKLKKDGQKRVPLRSAIMQIPKCDICFDLVFRVQTNNQAVANDLSENLLKAAFPSRYAGGTLHPPSLYDQVDWCQVYAKPLALFERIRSLPKGGSWLYPTSVEISSFEELAEQLTLRPTMRPAALGYLALEEPKSRQGSITQLHCYVEPVIGLLECVDAVTVRLSGARHFLNHGFWAMHCKKASMLMKKAKFEYD
ncbi:type I-F CRISPR-associated protein Csy2 [Pseudoalteromonas maricaloris]|uniref:type I-F CRISPR-associated protein Csy2 n=1 Tax=Pseudoalteromonas maricaloris TaxID=184924 RepID=UPI003C16ED48